MKKNEPLVSVIIPTKNRAEMLFRAVNSVRNQSYNNLEIIIVNDASDDNTLDIIKNFKKKDSRIMAFSNLYSKGGANARNVGIKHAKGEYISFLDDDDEWLFNKTEIQTTFLEKNSDIGAVSCWYILKIGEIIQKIKPPPIITFNDLLWENFWGSFSFCMVRKEVFKKIGLLDEILPSCQDWDFWLRITQKFKVEAIPQYLVLYHRHYQQRISTTAEGKEIGHERIYSKYINYMSKDCQKYHLKYIYFNKSLSSNPLKDKLKYLIKMICFFSIKRDFILFVDSLWSIFFSKTWLDAIKGYLRKTLVPKNSRIMQEEIYNKLHKDRKQG